MLVVEGEGSGVEVEEVQSPKIRRRGNGCPVLKLLALRETRNVRPERLHRRRGLLQ